MRKTKTSPNYQFFLKLKTTPYKGEWVAIARNKVIASGTRADEVFKKAQKKYPREKISLAKIPQEETLVLKIRLK